MRPAAVFTGLIGMAVVAGLLMAGEARLRGGTAGDETVSTEETASAAAVAAPEPGEPAISDEQAERIAGLAEPAPPPAPGAGAGPGDREAAKPTDVTQQAQTATQQAAGPAAKKPVELARPAVENAGSLSFGERRLQLAGVIPTAADKICGPAGRQWPCGMMAKTALRQLLRNRSVSCDLDTAEWKGTVSATCRLGPQDLGAWLIENGWAEAAAGSPLASAAETARQAGKGIYGDDPRRR
ncbi:endonuclease YncB(thermonuclease family) [Rhizobium leguminosarum]|uniref:Endonuclease YncB(Thermonuclease family) n=1 Tax=Rhizobium leguminosarum TaxID=384 RepID=A0AAE2MFB1_RHILE|nr:MULTISPECIES: thermonuclease family protein [Rhizobium]MBB4288333.1 endonuclease YncB(thermonuclease family) [Rhizobium leguminosarum]MBB4295574.1 endonuclease YncB(thermonuclease family) [Rhizobium leguminosarum]MBB4306968.1 endonuclease YncB(thermonuclease family) [Rhizobium leguminosarum]MBB4417450.1 endonuclease YncB(thermonuclease family) [Rhizobium leguminosarum]MBB4432294.1 endonuclease YncB(thermonuclease family) [Rhizobium esperanzae]